MRIQQQYRTAEDRKRKSKEREGRATGSSARSRRSGRAERERQAARASAESREQRAKEASSKFGWKSSSTLVEEKTEKESRRVFFILFNKK